MLYTLYIQGEYMPEKLTKFIETALENNIDDKLLKTPIVQKTIDNLENFGKDLGDKAEKILKQPPAKPPIPTPNYQESAFIKPKTETTLYNVTNHEKDIPAVTKCSNIFKNLSYSVRGFTAAAEYKDYSLYAGEKVGLGWNKTKGSVNTAVKAEYNVNNGKTKIEYSKTNPINSYHISVFKQKDNNGLTAGYTNSNGLSSTLSIDNHSASLSLGYYKNSKRYKIELNAYATTGEKYSEPFTGIKGRITF